MRGSLLFFLLGAANAANVQDCGSTAKDLSITIAGCSNADPVCLFASHQRATIEATFTSPNDFQSAKVQLTASIGILKIDFPLNPAEACGNWGLKCPAQAGSRQTLKVELPIDGSYPKIEVGVTLQLITDKGEKLLCKSFPVKIK
ncbi:Npc2-like protein [Metarhizium rileyi]|uniref:Phosphatidylglycerol/phosphatidylinositol transfer protein n=1 Tax=Metarhizium rileyi (strain RCEF 4871) TaxID=1649241 RepID=A0A167FCC4_METRR|nr:Npc2-like protein [Metarhizium rileyi RCEF 4871]TWU76986.1 hypothetical protein ED733_007417 [Metarhizium rileyi]